MPISTSPIPEQEPAALRSYGGDAMRRVERARALLVKRLSCVPTRDEEMRRLAPVFSRSPIAP